MDGFVSSTSSDPYTGERHHCQAYTRLRASIQNHVRSGDQPALGLCAPPTGGRAWQPTPAVAAAFSLDGGDQTMLQDAEDDQAGGGVSDRDDEEGLDIDVWQG